MQRLILAAFVAACCLSTRSAAAQTPAADSLARALMALSARLDSLEAGTCPSHAPLALPAPGGRNARSDSMAIALRALAERVAAQERARCPVKAEAGDDDLASLRAAAAAAAGDSAIAPADSGTAAAASGARSLSLLNPEISVSGDVRLTANDDPGPQTENGVDREFEFAFQSALDPYSTAKVFISVEQEEVGVEEGYLYWTGLPGKLRVDVGKFRQQIGELNRWHLHALPVAEYPLVYQRFFGEDGVSGAGLSIYTALPFGLAGGTHEIFLQGTTTRLDPFLAGSRQPVLLGRLQNFWQLSPSTYIQLGVTGMGGNNADSALTSRLVGLDARFTWRPPERAARRDVTLRAEGYKLHTTASGITANRYGTFVDLQARVSRRWVLGGRYDYAQSPRGPKDREWRITPALTWWQSEFVYLRLQGEHRNSDLDGTRNLLTLQAVFSMGPHKHETY